jgi:putative transcriptional regulator
MSEKNTIVSKRRSDGTLVQVLPDGSSKPLEDKTDWERLRAMTDEEVTAAAMSDLDARPMTPEQLRAGRRPPRGRGLRDRGEYPGTE